MEVAFLVMDRTTSADSQAQGETEGVFRDGVRVLTLAKSRAGKR